MKEKLNCMNTQELGLEMDQFLCIQAHLTNTSKHSSYPTKITLWISIEMSVWVRPIQRKRHFIPRIDYRLCPKPRMVSRTTNERRNALVTLRTPEYNSDMTRNVTAIWQQIQIRIRCGSKVRHLLHSSRIHPEESSTHLSNKHTSIRFI